MTDLIVAATAERAGPAILHVDKDFDLIADLTGQGVESLMLPGPPRRPDVGRRARKTLDGPITTPYPLVMSPQRPREHVLEELSRQAFREVLPPEWVVRPVDDDYGIDREVEIFSEGRTTGLTFKVQLKASDRASRSGPSHRVTTDQVEYWKSLDVPVLVVYWVVEAESLYGRWAHTLGREPGRNPSAKTMTVSYSTEDLLADPADQILHDVVLVRELRAGRLPRPIALRLRVDDSFTAASQAELIVRLRSLVRSRVLGSIIEVLPAGHDDHRPEFLVHLSGGRSNVLRASVPIDVASVRVTMPADAYAEYQGHAALDVLASDVLVAMAVALERTGARAPAARLLDGVARQSRITLAPEVAQVVGDLVDDHELVDEAVALLLRLTNSGDPATRDASDTYLRIVLQHLDRVDGSAQLSLVEQMR